MLLFWFVGALNRGFQLPLGCMKTLHLGGKETMQKTIAALKAAISWIQDVEILEDGPDRVVVDPVSFKWTFVPWNPIAIKVSCEKSHHCLTDYGKLIFDIQQFKTIVWMITQCVSEGKHLMSIQKELYEFCFTDFSQTKEQTINWLLYGICGICANCTATEHCTIEQSIVDELNATFDFNPEDGTHYRKDES